MRSVITLFLYMREKDTLLCHAFSALARKAETKEQARKRVFKDMRAALARHYHATPRHATLRHAIIMRRRRAMPYYAVFHYFIFHAAIIFAAFSSFSLFHHAIAIFAFLSCRF